LVGEGLFEFGDRDGVGPQARLQHALGVAYYQRKVIVADTYNNKLKLIDPDTRRCDTFLGDGQPGSGDQPPQFNEPAGLSVAGDLLFVADTNNHAIRVVDLKTKTVRTLALKGVKPPKPMVSTKPFFPDPVTIKAPTFALPPDGTLTLRISVPLAEGFKLNPEAPMEYLLEGVFNNSNIFEQVGKLDKPLTSFRVEIPVEKLKEVKTLKVSLAYYPCQEKAGGLCFAKSQVWEIPLQPGGTEGKREIFLQTAKQ
jgi:hypothetical protein